MSYRTDVCADAIKMIMFSFQYIISSNNEPCNESTEESLSAFLKIFFSILAEVIDYNGLPNNTKENYGSDSALGRMSAQSIVRIVRSSPSAFKASLLKLPEKERGVVEVAVRAEMSSYSSATTSRSKKKLKIKAFRKV